MEQLNVYEAKTRLSDLLNRVERGEEIIIARAGRPVARLVSVTQRHAPRIPGAWRGRVTMAADFDELPDDLTAAFAGEEAPHAPPP